MTANGGEGFLFDFDGRIEPGDFSLGAGNETAVVMTAAFAVFFAGFLQAHAASGECTMPLHAIVQVELSQPPRRSSDALSLAELRRAASAAGFSGPVVGAYQQTIAYHADIDATAQDVAQGKACLAPRSVIVHVQIERIIYIPREFLNDNCLSKLSREHEEKHAQAQDSVLDDLKPQIMSAVRKVIDENSRPAAPSDREALATFTTEVQSSIEAVLDKIEAERRRRNAAVDTPQEIDLLTSSCQGRAI